MIDFLGEIGAPTIFAATKIDKLSKREIAGRVAALAGAIGADPEQIIPFSAVTGEGRDDLAEAIVGLVGEPSWRAEPAPPEADDAQPAGAADEVPDGAPGVVPSDASATEHDT
jgi:GTP-binding protein